MSERGKGKKSNCNNFIPICDYDDNEEYYMKKKKRNKQKNYVTSNNLFNNCPYLSSITVVQVCCQRNVT